MLFSFMTGVLLTAVIFPRFNGCPNVQAIANQAASNCPSCPSNSCPICPARRLVETRPGVAGVPPCLREHAAGCPEPRSTSRLPGVPVCPVFPAHTSVEPTPGAADWARLGEAAG